MFAGDITLDEAVALARRDFGSWSGGAATVVAIPPPSPAPAGRIYLVDRQDAAQTVVSQFLPAPARQTPDYYSLRLADSVWGGGGFGTRLNLNLRENKGYSYGVFSNLALYRAGGCGTPAAEFRPTRPRSPWSSSTKSSRVSPERTRFRSPSSKTPR